MFQFHNGTINTLNTRCIKKLLKCFNSTTVQLILSCQIVSMRPIKFQFHNGTINTLVLLHGSCLHIRFNSTTVQLIPSTKLVTEVDNTFQFHNGTINTLTNTQKKQLKMSELANNKYAFYMINYVDG